MYSTIFNIETLTKQIFMNGQALPLNEQQYLLLQFFLKYPKRTFSKDQLLNMVLDIPTSAENFQKHIDIIISCLSPNEFLTANDQGYCFFEG